MRARDEIADPHQGFYVIVPPERERGAGPVIPRYYITEWREHAPWVQDAQVEQDLVISRALVEMFAIPEVGRRLVLGVASDRA